MNPYCTDFSCEWNLKLLGLIFGCQTVGFLYQSLLLEGPVTKLKVCGNLNPATFLPEKENETPDHDCSQFRTLNYAGWEDIRDTALDNPDMKIFTDDSSFVRDGKHKAGYAMVTAEQVLEAKSLPQGTSAQLAEL